MKKISFAIAACAIFAFAACGGGNHTENNSAADSLKKDSAMKAEAASKAADSAAKAEAAKTADSSKADKKGDKAADKKAEKPAEKKH